MKKLIVALLFLAMPLQGALAIDLETATVGEHRSEDNRRRDGVRHPVETLRFFQVAPDMTVVEIWPGMGWYTEILAPYLKDRGKLYAAHFVASSEVPYFNKIRGEFAAKLAADPDIYSDVEVAEFNPGRNVLTVPEASADRVLTFRNVHNWLRDNSEQKAFDLFFKVLKPGGLLGVVEHRAPADKDRQWMLDNGYVTEAYVIELAEKAGFTLVGKSDINSNPKDSAEHPAGVWSLPPTLRLADTDKEKYLAIGESDRMTLLFAKPGN